MDTAAKGALRPPRSADFRDSLARGWRDLRAAPVTDLCLASVFVVAGLLMTLVTVATGQTFWLVLAVMGFPLIGTLAAVGFYETSRRLAAGLPARPGDVLPLVWAHRHGQLPWLGAIVVVIFLFWFFLGHMIFALFLGLSPMTNVLSSAEVLMTSEGLWMLATGTAVGAGFAALVFAISVAGMPMLVDRDVDFITAMSRSVAVVAARPLPWLGWGLFVALVTLVSMLPLFLGLFVTMPLLGHATWHLYARLADGSMPGDRVNGSLPKPLKT